MKNAWSSAAAEPGSSTRQGSEDVVIWTGGLRSVAFSGLTGSFSAEVSGLPQGVTLDSELAIVEVQGRTLLFSAVRGGWTAFPGVPLLAPRTGPATALFQTTGQVHAFSTMTGQVASLTVQPTKDDVAANVAAVWDGVGQAHLFSAITGGWSAAPQDALPAMPLLAAQCALLATTSGFTAFSVRSGRFIPLAAPTGKPWIDALSSICAIEVPGRLHVFEARRDAWIDTPIANRSLQTHVWRTVLLAEDGSKAYGFGSQAGEIEAMSLPEAPFEVKANSEVGRMLTNHWILAFSPLPDLTSGVQYPEFRRVQKIGSNMALQLQGKPGSPAVLGLGTLSNSPLTFPTLGTLWLDLSSLVTLPLLPPDLDGRSIVKIPVPETVALVGLELWLQAAVNPAGGTPYLSRAATVALW
jgi:hypothetical protein